MSLISIYFQDRPSLRAMVISILIPLAGLLMASCARSGVLVTERSDSQAMASLYLQKPGVAPVAYEVTSRYQKYGFGRAVENLESDPMPWAVLGGDSSRATTERFAEWDDPSLIVSAITLPTGSQPSLRGTITGPELGLSIEEILRDFQRQIQNPVLVVMLGTVSTNSFNNNNELDDWQDAVIQVVIIPEGKPVPENLAPFIPDRRRVSSDDPRFTGVLIPLTDTMGLNLDKPQTMRFAVKTVEDLTAGTRVEFCQFIAFDLSNIELRKR